MWTRMTLSASSVAISGIMVIRLRSPEAHCIRTWAAGGIRPCFAATTAGQSRLQKGVIPS